MGCSLWITVARTDAPFMRHTIPHLVRMCRHPFVERVLAIDVAPLSGEKVHRPGLGSMEELRSICARLKEQGVVDKVVNIDYSADRIKAVYQKHLGDARVKATHNYKGYPVYGSMWCIEEAKGDYFLHFDSDMLLYQEKGSDWIAGAVRLMEEDAQILWARPSAGPQTESSNLYTQRYKCRKDPRGFYQVGGFSSRCFLLHKKRFEGILPMKVLWAKRQGTLKGKLPRPLVELFCDITGTGLLDSWETIVSRRVVEKGLVSAHLADRTWTIHAKDHGADLIKALPSLIERIEQGYYPVGQAGKVDLQLDLW